MPSPKSQSGGARPNSGPRSSSKSSASGDAQGSLAEQLLNKVINPLGLVVLTRDRIQEILDDATARGRVTRSDANELVAELVDRGRQQTDQLLSDAERLLGRGREQIGATMRARRGESLDLLLRSADRARRTVSAGESFPILSYDELTAAQVQRCLGDLSPAELRKVRDYERRHANRKSVLAAIDKHLTSD
jgi:polyhydroxyalkanoate synthesis regulator phasin